jgi:hypothetical protein
VSFGWRIMRQTLQPFLEEGQRRSQAVARASS